MIIIIILRHSSESAPQMVILRFELVSSEQIDAQRLLAALVAPKGSLVADCIISIVAIVRCISFSHIYPLHSILLLDGLRRFDCLER